MWRYLRHGDKVQAYVLKSGLQGDTDISTIGISLTKEKVEFSWTVIMARCAKLMNL
jgi:hypothetical protein